MEFSNFILRPGQEEVLSNLRGGKSVFACLPTGYGKSLCYEIPAHLWKWKTIVIAPLKALLDSQYQLMVERGVMAVIIHSGLSANERKKSMQTLESGEWEILSISPELLEHWWKNKILEHLLRKHKVGLFVLDEVHCAVEWKKFRSSYLLIDGIIKEIIAQKIPVLGLSATLEAAAIMELKERWPINFSLVQIPLGRSNLYLHVKACENRNHKLLILLFLLKNIQSPKAAIIYCASREETELLASFLTSCGLPACVFHAGLPEIRKMERVQQFLNGYLPILCATTAFGMGVHYPFVEKVIHWGLPSGLTEYWQQAGRAGRSGDAAESILLWSRSDILSLRALKVEEQGKIRAILRYLLAKKCRKSLLTEYFCIQDEQENCGNCDVCLKRELLPGKLFSEPVWWEGGAQYAEKNFLNLLGFGDGSA